MTLDTSGIVALIDVKDENHGNCLRAMREDGGPYIVPAGILSEIAWILEARFAAEVEQAFLDDLRDGAYTLHWNQDDIQRIQVLIRKYGDLPLGFADAAVAACAERHNGRVLTTDFRHFSVLSRGEKGITALPEPAWDR
ncbi:MAG: type II toxin-antitoxin system VapC family toxin [Chloroflexota bacterium]